MENTSQTQYLARLDYIEGWEGQGSKFASKATKKIGYIRLQAKADVE